MRHKIIEIRDLTLPDLDIFARMTDSQLLHAREPEPGLFIVESANVILRALRDGYEPEALIVEKRRLTEMGWQGEEYFDAGECLRTEEAFDAGECLRTEEVFDAGECLRTEEAFDTEGVPSIRGDALDTDDPAMTHRKAEIPNSGDVRDVLAAAGDAVVYTSEVETLNGLVGYKLTGGIVCAMRRRELPELAEIVRGKRRIVVLEKVMNPINVGSIFRSAAALNIDAVLLTAGSTDPLYRRSSRVSMGTVFQVPWTYIPITKEAAEDASTGTSDEVTSASAGEVASASAGEVTSASAGEVASASAGEVASASAGEVTSASAGEVISVSAGKVASEAVGEVISVSAGKVVIQPAEVKAKNGEEKTKYRPLHPRKAPVRPSAEEPGRYVRELQKLGFRTAALALTDRSVSITHEALQQEERLAIIMGTEGEGLLPETLEDSDYTVKIPMSHGVDSLNVAAASAVAFWQLAGPAE